MTKNIQNYKLSIIYILLNVLIAQEIPNEFFVFKKNKILIDSGSSWLSNTSLGQLRFQNLILDQNSINSYFKARYGLISKNQNLSYYGFGMIHFNENIYCYSNSRIVTDPNEFQRFTGIPRKKNRFGFNSGETDLAGIGYQNEVILLQLGRGRESWGSGNNIQIALSEDSPSYDYILFGANWGKVKFRSINGFLESDSLGFNRYISGRGFEYNNKNNFLISFSEIVIYSGINRPFDLAYLNPVGSHLEIELNNRQNLYGTSSGNAIWQLSLDWLTNFKLRFSSNILFDEIILDKIEKNSGKESMYALSNRLCYNLISNGKHVLNLAFTNIFIGAQTFRHESGYNNFVQRGLPLGWNYGSNGRESKLELDYFIYDKFLLNVDFGIIRLGNNSIINNQYEPYVNYNSDNINYSKKFFLKSQVQWWIKENLSIYIKNELINSSSENIEFQSIVGIDIYHSFFIENNN